MYVDHFGNSNIQEWLDEHKDEFVGNVEEEVLDGAGLVKEVAPGHRDVGDTNDEEENCDDDDDEDEDVDGDEDDHQKPHFFYKGHWPVISCGGMKFEARKMDEAFTVDVEKKECSCRLWQLNGYGCIHSVATLAYLN
ncbi:unnamed protein product [Lactuca virosa]|uniref:SWIM-type domain-containing protein n=1 Tax=Lactuca virosa TaxID=75947 RepID=A0AAU9P9B8_9ASTR|nr:unnamed protein product [Lactuca virosa]